MKNTALTFMAIMALSSFSFAGGDFATADSAVEPIVIVEDEDNSAFYVGLGLNYNRTYSDKSAWFDVIDSQDETGGLTGIIGYNFNEYIAVEGRIAKSLFEEDYADVLSYSLFVKPQYPITEDFSIYALLGFGNVTVEGTDKGGLEFGFDPNRVGETIMDESGFQWGIGVGYVMNEDFSLFLDYVSLAKDADIDTTSLYYYNGAAPYPYDILSNDTVTMSVAYTF